MKVRAIIVDDVKLARDRLKLLLTDEQVDISAECRNGREAIEAIRTLKPDLVFLDVQMPKIGGFDVVTAIGPENMPSVIFATAFDEFAVRAFEVNAMDYLLKPIDKERLSKAMARVRGELNVRKVSSEMESRLRKLLKDVNTEKQFLKRVAVSSSGETIFIAISDIDWIAAAGHYIELHVGGQHHLIRESITNMETKLDPELFVRIHRSTIVNLDRIKSMQPLFNGDHLIVLHDGTELNLSRTYHEQLFSRLLR